MSILDDTYLQLCERLITKEVWNKHLDSSRHLYKEAHGYWAACFHNRKLTGNDSIILEKIFWKKIFTARCIKELDEFLITYFMMTTNLINYIPVCQEFRNERRALVESHFQHDLYNMVCGEERFSYSVTLEGRSKSRISIIEKLGGPIPNSVFDYTFEEMQNLHIKAF